MNQRALLGKIARLPHFIRHQLNQRLHNGQLAPEILPWLNKLPPVQKMLADHFAGAPINHRNLSNWRALGYPRWLEEQKPFLLVKEHSRDARKFARAARGLASGAAAIAADRLFQALRSGEINSTADLLKILPSIMSLLKADHNSVRLKHEKTRIQQRDAQLLLLRDKHQRDIAAISLRVLGDDRAKLIEAAPINYEEKIKLIGRHMFGDLWQPRILPVPPELPAASKRSEDGSKNKNATTPPTEKGSAGVSRDASSSQSPADETPDSDENATLSQRERDGALASGASANSCVVHLWENPSDEKPRPDQGEGGLKLKTQPSKLPDNSPNPSNLPPPEITSDKTTTQLIAEIEEYSNLAHARKKSALVASKCNEDGSSS